MGGAATVLTGARAATLAIVAALLVTYVAVAEQLWELPSSWDAVVVGLVVLPAFTTVIWLALPLARGPVWRDPATGRRAEVADAPRTYAERWSTDGGRPDAGSTDAAPTEGGHDGRDRT